MRDAARAFVLWATLCAGCGDAAAPPARAPAPRPVPRPVATATAAPLAPSRDLPPASGPERAATAPKVVTSELANGVGIAVAERPGSPLVSVRVVVDGGSRADGSLPGVAALTARAAKEGGAGPLFARDVLVRFELLGATLAVETTQDASIFGASVPKDAVEPALALLSLVVREARFSPPEVAKLKARMAAETALRARSDGWVTHAIARRALFAPSDGRHPYAYSEAKGAEVLLLAAADCRANHARFYVPEAITVVIAGDVSADAARAWVDHAFGAMTGAAPTLDPIPEPGAPEATGITVVHRPKAAEAEAAAAVLGPRRSDTQAFAAFAVAAEILGGEANGRLARSLRDERGLVHDVGATVVEHALGASMLVLRTRGTVKKGGASVEGMLEAMRELGGARAASNEEVAAAARQVLGAHAAARSTAAGVADGLARARAMRLPGDADEAFRKAVSAVTPEAVAKAAAASLRDTHPVVVVAGDADVLAEALRAMGEVRVVDPDKGMEPVRSIAAAPSGPKAP